MKLRYEDLLKGLEFALNYHGIDAKANTADYVLAAKLAPQLIHGAECAKRGLDPAMTAMLKTTVAHLQEVSQLDEMAETLRPVKTEQDIAALAERLAKVEDRQAELDKRQDRHDDRIDASERQTRDRCGEIDKRITSVAEIFGDRVAELGDEIGAALDSAKRAHERLDELEGPSGWLDTMQASINALERPEDHIGITAAFPTGAATTVDQVLDQNQPVHFDGEAVPTDQLAPKRGDRVRLEGSTRVINGWYDVVGHDSRGFQVSAPGGFLFWIENKDPSLKEVRHAQ